ncbi:uncharacterized protein VTP21DRAFT_8879 [Calcarisporiella thermophila]|uniref:uncharacterized protein n=1 Tax=Calcarisporiella thermophila TaxID=911321 RepID=UPI0037421C3A
MKFKIISFSLLAFSLLANCVNIDSPSSPFADSYSVNKALEVPKITNFATKNVTKLIARDDPIEEDTTTCKNSSICEKQIKEAINGHITQESPLTCETCVALEASIRALYRINKKALFNVMYDLCGLIPLFDSVTCKGIVDTQGPALFDVINRFRLHGYDGHLLCASIFRVCPNPNPNGKKIAFPKTKPADAAPPKNSGETIKVLHLSDWHVDSKYEAGSDAFCKRTTCCRADSSSNPPRRAASKWGDYRCDTPQLLADNLIENVLESHKIKLGFLTGDLVAHDIWVANETSHHKDIRRTWDDLNQKLSKHVDTFFPVVGNHDFLPSNLAQPKYYPNAPKRDPQYTFFADNWRKFLDDPTTKEVVDNTGAYSFSPKNYPKLKVIALNTNWCYSFNFYNFYHAEDHPDPNSMLAWVIKELQQAEDNRQRVWILGHHPSGQKDCLFDYSHLFYQIVQRYSPHVIAGIFFGHTHRDEFEVFYADEKKRDAENALAVAYIGPSVTAYTQKNPTYRVYMVDTQSFSVVDSYTYFTDISKAKEWENENKKPEWKLEYSAKDTYSFNTKHNPLTPAWWHSLTQEFEKNDELFQKYFHFRSGSAGRDGKCDEECKKELICQMRAGKTELGCFSNGPIGRRALHTDDQEDVPLWKRDLCSGFHGH